MSAIEFPVVGVTLKTSELVRDHSRSAQEFGLVRVIMSEFAEGWSGIATYGPLHLCGVRSRVMRWSSCAGLPAVR